MNNELLFLIKKHTDTLIEQTKSKPQETLEFKMNKQTQTFSFNPPKKLIEEGKWLLRVTSLDCTISVPNINGENNSFSINIPGHCNSKSAEKTIDKLNGLLKLKSQNNIDLHVQEVRKRGHQIKIGDKEYKLSDFETQKNEILEELKNTEYNELEDMVYRFQLTYDGIIDILDLKYVSTRRTCNSLNPNIYQTNDINKTLKYISPDNVKISVNVDEKILRTNLKINQTLIFSDTSFFIPY